MLDLFKYPGTQRTITTEFPPFEVDETSVVDKIYVRWDNTTENTHIKRISTTSGKNPIQQYAWGKWADRETIAEESWLALYDYQTSL